MIIGGLVFSCSVLAYRLETVAADARDQSDEMRLLEETAGSLSRDRAALWQHLIAHPLASPFLVGATAVTGELLNVAEPNDGVYMLMAETCPACPRNYPFLNELHISRGGFDVVGMVLSNDLPAMYLSTFESLSRHVTDLEVLFPVVFEPTGSLLEVVPLWGTPLVLVFSDGEPTYMAVGALSDGQKADIREILGSE